MKIKTDHAERELLHLSGGILKDPPSWKGWQCLVMRVRPAVDGQVTMGDFSPVRTFLESFLEKTEGSSYFCAHGVYIICRDLPAAVLEDVIAHLRAVPYDSKALFAAHDLYDLADEAMRFMEDLRQDEHFKDLRKEIPSHALWHPEKIQLDLDEKQEEPDGKVFVLGRGQSEDLESTTPRQRVLLVDDDPVILWMVRHSLSPYYDVVTAESSDDALALYQERRADVVLLDINMPGKDGFAVLAEMIHHDPSACVVMLSANDNMDNMARALQNGACAFVSKPFTKETLVETIREHSP